MDIDQVVFSNLSRFKDHLTARSKASVALVRRVYLVIVDCETGEINFSRKIPGLEYEKGFENINRPLNSKLCQITVSGGLNPSFAMEGDAHLATQKMIHLLNRLSSEIGKFPSGVLPETYLLKNLSRIHSELFRKGIESISGWKGSISATESEKLLEKKKQGSYLIRRDSDVSLMIDQMQKHFGFEIHSYALVFVGEKDKIVEHLILGIPKGWILYEDEPDLTKYQVFELPDLLLQHLGFSEIDAV